MAMLVYNQVWSHLLFTYDVKPVPLKANSVMSALRIQKHLNVKTWIAITEKYRIR